MHTRLIASLCLLVPALAFAQAPAVAPTRVTVKVDNVTTEEAIAAVARASGIAMNLNHLEKDEHRVTLDHTDAPLMDVIADLMRQAKLLPLHMGGGGPAVSFQVREPLSIVRPDPTTLVLVSYIRTEGSTTLRPERNAMQYVYNVHLFVMFDPAREVISVGQRTFVDDLVYPNADFRRSPDGQVWMQKVDCRPMSVFACEVGINSDERVERFDRMKLRLRAWQAAERATVTVEGARIFEGMKAEKDGLVLQTSPPSPDGTLMLDISGPTLALYRKPPWSGAIASTVRIHSARGPMSEIRCAHIARGKGETAEIHIGGEDRANRKRPFVPPIIDDIDSITLSVPTKVRVIDIPIELIDVPIP